MPMAAERKPAARHPRIAFAAAAWRRFPSTSTTDSTGALTLTWAQCTARCARDWPAATSTRPTSTRRLACATNSEGSAARRTRPTGQDRGKNEGDPRRLAAGRRPFCAAKALEPEAAPCEVSPSTTSGVADCGLPPGATRRLGGLAVGAGIMLGLLAALPVSRGEDCDGPARLWPDFPLGKLP